MIVHALTDGSGSRSTADAFAGNDQTRAKRTLKIVHVASTENHLLVNVRVY